MKPNLPLLLFAFLFPFFAGATHLRGGYIRAESTSSGSLTYKIQIIMFGDTGSQVSFGGGEISFGDGEVYLMAEGAGFDEVQSIGNETNYSVIEMIHTYPAFGTYTIEIKEYYRNAGILNMDNSAEAPFYAETTITVGPEIGVNTTPSLITTPAIWTKAGTRFYGSIASADEEGDSLVYSLAAPKEIYRAGTEEEEVRDFNFKWPNSSAFYDLDGEFVKPALLLDPLSGQLVWDTPLVEGEFALAYRVLEYRKVAASWVKISESLVDVQLINDASGGSAPGVVFDYEVAEDGRIGFTVSYTAEDSVQWLFYSDQPVEWQGETQQEKYVGGEGSGELVFSGFLPANPTSSKPIVVLAEAAPLSPQTRFKSIKSFAINPAGKEYVLTSVSNAGIPAKLNIYPNPTSGLLNIDVQGEIAGNSLEVQVLSFSGQSILKGGVPLSGKLATLNVEGIPAGLYLLKVSINGKTSLSKLVKN